MLGGLNLTILSKFNEMEIIFLSYLMIINIMSFAIMGIDKSRAKKNKYRISENVLIGLSVIGGAMGSLIGMVVFKHKTNKAKFYIGIPIIYMINQIITLVIFNNIK